MARFLVLTKYDRNLAVPPMTEWAPDDLTRLFAYLRAVDRELIERGELVEAQSLAGPELAKIVTSDGQGAPVVTDRPFPEVEELLAGYQMVDVESEARVIEIAAKMSAAPGPGGVPLQRRIEVRRVLGPRPSTDLWF
jgi:hypothetical protein